MKSRKTNRAKRVDPGCKNNGSCKVCQGNRTAANVRAVPADLAAPYRETRLSFDVDPYDWDEAWWDDRYDLMPEDLPPSPRFTIADVLVKRAA